MSKRRLNAAAFPTITDLRELPEIETVLLAQRRVRPDQHLMSSAPLILNAFQTAPGDEKEDSFRND